MTKEQSIIQELGKFMAKVMSENPKLVMPTEDLLELEQALNALILKDVLEMIGGDNAPLSNEDQDRDAVCLNCDYFLEWEGDPINCRCRDHNDFKDKLRKAARAKWGSK